MCAGYVKETENVKWESEMPQKGRSRGCWDNIPFYIDGHVPCPFFCSDRRRGYSADAPMRGG